MYPLVVLSLIAVALLLAGRTREGLAFNDKITAPELNEPWIGAAVQKILPMISNEMNAFVAEVKAANPSISVANAQRYGTRMFDRMLYNYSNTNYRNATTPITISDIDAYLQANPFSVPPESEQPPASFVTAVNNLRRAAMKAYFIDQIGSGTPAASATSSPTPNSQSGNQAPSPMLYEQLRKEFEEKKSEYDSYVDEVMKSRNPTEEDIVKIRNLNRKMFELLEKAITALGSSQAKDMETASRELAEIMARVEQEYNALSQNSDRVETLRRIRQFEEVRAGDSVSMYMILLIILAVAVLITMIFSQRVSTTTAIPPASPASTASLI